MGFALTAIQKKAREVLNSAAKFILLFGGSRSGKTFVILRNILIRALKEPFSRHIVFRQTRKSLKESVWLDTLPKVLRLCFGGIEPYQNDQELYLRFENGSEVWFSYLDDNRNSDAILGKEYNTIFLNEISEISFAMFNKVLTRLSLKNGLKNKLYCDCNPPGRWHWAYKVWIEKQNPADKTPLVRPQDYASCLLNPTDNLQNLPEDYLTVLQGLSEEERNRFLLGVWSEGIAGGIYTKEMGLAEQQGRIKKLEYDPRFRVYTFWDLGVDDSTAIVFAQFVGKEIRVLDYYANNNEGMDHYVDVLRQKREEFGYSYGTLFIPHDGANREWITGRNRRQALEAKGFTVEVLPADRVADGINGAKMLFENIFFDADKTQDLLECLRNYQRKYDANRMIFSKEPLHNWASHGADAFRYMAQGYSRYLAKPVPQQITRPEGITFNDVRKHLRRRTDLGKY